MQTIIITLNNGKKEEYVKGIKVKEILDKMSKEEREDAILIKYNNKKVDLETELKKNGTLQIYDINTLEGNRIYERGLLYLFIYVTNNILGKDTKVIVKHSIDKGIFCKIDKELEDKDVSEIKKQMKELATKNIPFTKMDTTKYEAIEYFKSIKREDKAKTLFYDPSKYVSLYKLDDYYNYLIGDLPSSTGVFKYFDLSLIKDKGIVVRFPSIYDNKKVKRYTHHTNYFNTLEEYSTWGNNLNINNIGELNDYITSSSNKPEDIIQLSEIMQDYKLLSIAEQIVLNKEDYKIILLSGPSSSGKTTSAMKLSLYLKSLGLNPTHLSLDDYFHERAETPLGEDGKPDFESITAIDIKLFDNQISKLLKGTKVTVPTFNFIDGKKEYKRTVELKENDILIIEGLHALNEELLTNIPRKKKFKIYVSPLTYLNIDNDNRISMTDIRLLRRMVRDNRTRGYSPSVTLGTWMKVRSGEEKHVFPYQDNADALFNTSLAYELSVLKTYAEPLLFSIKEDDPEYQTAQRLIELLKFILPIPSESVPKTSILREFIGGSYFE